MNASSDLQAELPSNSLSAMIIVKDVTKRYARAVAVDQISFSVAKGQIVGFLGPNGAGKTTTMRILTCFLSPIGRHGLGCRLRCSGTALRGQEANRISCPKLRLSIPRWRPPNICASWASSRAFPGADLEKRVDYVCDRCFVADVKNQASGQALERLSPKGRSGAGHHPQPRRADS